MNKIYVIFIALFFGMMSCSYIFDYSQNKTLFVETVRQIRAPKRIVNGTLALLVPASLDTKKLDTCSPLTPIAGVPYNLSAVLGVLYGGCDIEKHATLIQNLNASVAILVADTYEVVANYISGDLKKIRIPVLLTGVNQAKILAGTLSANSKLGKLTIITLTEDKNSWITRTTGAGMIVFQIIILTCYTVILVMIIRALILFFKLKTMDTLFKLEPGEQILLLDLLALIFAILSVIDPFNIRGSTNRTYVFITLIITFPLLLMGMLRLAFFYTEILIRRKMMNPKFNLFVYPFVVVSAVAFILYLVLAILFSINSSNSELLLAASVVNIIFLFFTISFYLATAIVMNTSVKTKRSEFLKKRIPFLATVTLGALLYFICNVIFIVNYQAKIYSTDLFEATFVIFWVAIIFILGGQVFFFRKPTDKLKSMKSKTAQTEVPMDDDDDDEKK